ncbi:3'(2'),5'-bisphosphate nucleotidase CysQ [Chromobacterium sp. IIBBL 290-4]|uniref:3'(2'),5'-bisphosphate nucleotidase CysQ n=1 Tax=Chromobacterium sp. IIBBL 290-4 TaxID=2953890 RepID=UPI0020B75DDB|nr:3'(2'),5'-bisphosphate nucleotidase CysQ [Chromobacterium sp. IIBBL 290-4]UTH73628.1 3'(2'),5'-bisphosphate nucleotidase CysQ [Chromobacterium sp. IIBBL 290-4]
MMTECLTGLDDHALAERLAARAGEWLLRLRADFPEAGKPLGKAGDAGANERLLQWLRQARPDDGVLSEESPSDAARLSRRRVWIIDPLDGTREYGERALNRPDWAVHVALAVDGLPVAAAVALPARGQTFGTASPMSPHRPPGGKLKILVSRSRAPEIACQVAERLDAELLPMGSAGAKAMAVLRGEAHAYLHDGGQYEWDSCAPVGVARAAGLHASRLDGSACLYNQPDPYLPDLLICHPEWAEIFLTAIRAANA